MNACLNTVRIAALAFAVVTPGLAHADGFVQWRGDYNTARREATEQARPVFIDFGTEACLHCQRLDATTFRDPVVIELLNTQFVPLKLDGNAVPSLVQALKITAYPTLVIASPEGKIIALIEGYMTAERLTPQLQRALTTATPDWMARDYREAGKALDTGDYARAVTLLRGLMKDGKNRPVQAKAKTVLYDIEQHAATQVARAKEMEDRGQSVEAADALTKVLKSYAGTAAADDAAKMLARVGSQPEMQLRQRGVRAQELLAVAREGYRTGNYIRCLDNCDVLTAAYGDLPEGESAKEIANAIKSDPEIMKKVVQGMDEKMANMYVALADAWAKKGRPIEARECLERVAKMCPESTTATVALRKLKDMEDGSAMRPVEGAPKQ